MQPRRVRRQGRPFILPPTGAQPVRNEYGPKRFLWLRRSLVGAAALGLLIGLLFGLKISSLNVVPSGYSELLQPQAEQAISAHPLWRNLLFLPSGTLSKQLETANQTVVGKVAVHKNFFKRSLTLEVGDRVAVLRWQTNAKTYTLDSKGVVIAEVGGSDSPQLPLVVDASNLPVEINKVAASNKFVQFITDAWSQMPAATGLTPTGARVADTTNEVQITTNQGFYIRFDTTRAAAEQLEEAKRVLEKDKPAQYLDVRLPYKAYFR